MAVSFVYSVANFAANATSVGVTIASGAGIQSGDTIVASVTHTKSGTFSATGFTDLGGRSNDATASMEVLIKPSASGSENGTTITFTSTGTSGRLACDLRVYRGVDTTSNPTLTTTNVTASTTFTSGSGVTVGDGGMIVAFYGGTATTAGAQGTWTAPSGYGHADTTTNSNPSGTNSNMGGSDIVATSSTPSATVSTSTTGAIIVFPLPHLAVTTNKTASATSTTTATVSSVYISAEIPIWVPTVMQAVKRATRY